ncbi:MAG: hypothetical protein HY243_01500 [Proteobacteria bacterium]|nr:hypothetical protein [Pseudomonadota bacterium]
MASSDKTSGAEIYVEFVVLGNAVKATAIHAASGIEASIVGPATAPQATLAQAAVRKLEYVLKKKGT